MKSFLAIGPLMRHKDHHMFHLECACYSQMMENGIFNCRNYESHCQMANKICTRVWIGGPHMLKSFVVIGPWMWYEVGHLFLLECLCYSQMIKKHDI